MIKVMIVSMDRLECGASGRGTQTGTDWPLLIPAL
jgi:hypothetical protein